jgi:hypothetical protein
MNAKKALIEERRNKLAERKIALEQLKAKEEKEMENLEDEEVHLEDREELNNIMVKKAQLDDRKQKLAEKRKVLEIKREQEKKEAIKTEQVTFF